MADFKTPAIASIDEAVVAININRTYSPTLSSAELFDYTRGIWRLNRLRADKAELAFAVYKGSIIEVYKIHKWVTAGSTHYKYRVHTDDELKGRFEFVGHVADEDVRARYVGKMLPERHVQNPIKYFNCSID